MKISETPTKYLLVRASTNSDWDTVDFIIIDLGVDDWNNTILNRIANAKKFREDTSFNHLAFYDQPEGYYINDLDGEDCFDLDQDKNCFFIDMTLEEYGSLVEIDSALDTHSLKVDSNGLIQFVSYGKHTGEEFWSSHFDFQKSLDEFKTAA